jgi:hypothetical protein
MMMMMMMMMMMIIIERRASKNIATASSLYNYISTIHNRCYPKQITQKLETA